MAGINFTDERDYVKKLTFKGEIWKDIKGYEGYYQASNTGLIRSMNYNHTKKTKVLKGGFDKDGYKLYSFCVNGIKKTIKAHRIILQTFVKNEYNKPFVNHINGVKDDNRIDNLEWSTNSENQIHAYEIGLHKKQYGEKNGMYGKKHSEETIQKIKNTLSKHFEKKARK